MADAKDKKDVADDSVSVTLTLPADIAKKLDAARVTPHGILSRSAVIQASINKFLAK